MYNHILVALDGSEIAEQVLPHIEALADKFGAAVTLLRVTLSPGMVSVPGIGFPTTVPADLYTSEQLVEALEDEHLRAGEYLKSVVERLRARLPQVQVTEELAEGQAPDVIVERASALSVDLIAMTTHGRSGLSRLVLGSVAEDVVRRAPCAVLLVRVHTDQHQTQTQAHPAG